ncbi:butyrophilin-like protein 1 isoform X2 [Xenopus laevis]|nr:butyrophilin-like protein 1 isoform X2 [Xenopus laevis]
MPPIMHQPLIQFIITGLLWLGTSGQSVRFTVSSVSSVSVPIGSDATLYCNRVPEMNAENMEINWFRTSYIPYVHMYNRGAEDKSKQMAQFANRTKLLKQNITRGGMALLIRKVTIKDLGKYYCYFESDDHHGKATVELKGTVIGSVPNVSYTELNGFVVCESYGWFPQPYVIWTDSARNPLNSSWTEVLREDDLFGVTSVIPVIPGSNITCTVTNYITESRQSSALIPEIYTEIKPSPESCNWYFYIIIIISCVLIICMVLLCIFYLWKKAQERKCSAETALPPENEILWERGLCGA